MQRRLPAISEHTAHCYRRYYTMSLWAMVASGGTQRPDFCGERRNRYAQVSYF